MSNSTTNVTEPSELFSARLRRETAPDHNNAESDDVMIRLLRGELPLSLYLELVVQLQEVYRTLEDCARRTSNDPRIGAFMDPVLNRVDSLAIDRKEIERRLAMSGGDVLPATRNFCARIDTVTRDQPLLLLAHHYTRYLGDLSGGVMIGRSVDKTFGFDGGPGVTWFQFPLIDDSDAYKNTYRARLDSLEMSADESNQFVAEAHMSYALNGAMLRSVSALAR
ncbi:MAG: heme oxygenase (biliverdin-producing) [Actinomycetota bacterium]